MSLLERLRSVLGLNGTGDREVEEPAAVTVERDPETIGEPTDEEVDSVTVDESPVETETAPPEETTVDHDGEVTEISGIGPAYSERLADAGITSIRDLASADPAELADDLDLSTGRVSQWVADAKDFAGNE